jgi:hypothetical protein
MKHFKICCLPSIVIATLVISSVVFASTESSDADMISTLQGWLAEKEGSAASKEAILSAVMLALEDDLPVTMLIDKIKEGLGPSGVPQPKAPLLEISQEIARRAQLLSEVRALLWSKGIFSAPEGTQAAVPSLPPERFDYLVNEIADALGDYLEGEGSPQEGHLLFQEVSHRLFSLSQLTEPVISLEDVNLVLNPERGIKPGDLTYVVLKALESMKQ